MTWRALAVASLATTTVMAKGACDPAGLSPGDTCRQEWRELQTFLRPTQSAVGYAWVLRGYEKDMVKEKDCQREMDDSVIPVAKRGGALYVVDGHHTLAGLDRSGHTGVKVTVNVVCDYSDLAQADFWPKMAANGFAYLAGRPGREPTELPKPIDPASLPTEFRFGEGGSSFEDDPWRSLAGYVRKIKASDGTRSARCFNRMCSPATGQGINYFEFRWAYFFNDGYLDTALWQDEAAHTAFKSAFDGLRPTRPGDSGVPAEWLAKCEALLPLCRGKAAGAYLVPIEEMAGSLPGWHSGSGPIDPDDDPSCKGASCPDLAASGNASRTLTYDDRTMRA